MLPKSHRLPHSVRLNSARSLRTEFFMIKSISTSNPASRFGVVISKKVDKSAVARNRMRRVIHQAVKSSLLLVSGSHDVLFIVQRPFESLAKQTEEEIVAFLNRTA